MESIKGLNDFEINKNNIFALTALKCFATNYKNENSVFFCCKDKDYRNEILKAFKNDRKINNRKVKLLSSKNFLENNEKNFDLIKTIDTLIITNVQEIENNELLENNLETIICNCKSLRKLLIIGSDRELEDLNFNLSLKNKINSSVLRLRIFE